MKSLQIMLVFSLSALVEKETAKAEQPAVANAKVIEATVPAANVSAPSQTLKPEKLILVRDGELFQMYRRQNEAEVRAAAQEEMARQAEIEEEKLRLIALLSEQAKAE